MGKHWETPYIWEGYVIFPNKGKAKILTTWRESDPVDGVAYEYGVIEDCPRWAIYVSNPAIPYFGIEEQPKTKVCELFAPTKEEAIASYEVDRSEGGGRAISAHFEVEAEQI